MSKDGLKTHQNRTPSKMARPKAPKGKTLAEIRKGAKK
jgi:hypothetical protein